MANGNGHKPREAPQDGAESSVAAPKPLEHPNVQPELLEHFCPEHQVEFKGYTRGNNAWWSHKNPDGKWCLESRSLIYRPSSSSDDSPALTKVDPAARSTVPPG